jgi:hypothetical protein
MMMLKGASKTIPVPSLPFRPITKGGSPAEEGFYGVANIFSFSFQLSV